VERPAAGSTFLRENLFFLAMSILLQRARAIHAREAAPLARSTFGCVIEEEDTALIFTVVQPVLLCLGQHRLSLEPSYKARSVPIPPHALHLVKELEA
jgi:hypothetical protein